MMSELLKLKLEELTFDIAVAKYIAIEQSYKDVEALQGGKEANPVGLLSKSKLSKKPKPKKEVKSPEKRGSPFSKGPGDRSCYRCLGNHDHKTCPFLNEKCHHCNKTDHIARACKAKKRETQAAHPPIHYVDGDDGDSNDYLGCLEVNNMSNKDHVIWVNPEVQGRVIKMELDTGSAESVLPYKQYNKHFGHVKLAKSPVTLKTYTGKGQEKELTLQVVDTPGPALFESNWLSQIQLNWGEIKALKLSKTPQGVMQQKVDQLLKQ